MLAWQLGGGLVQGLRCGEAPFRRLDDQLLERECSLPYMTQDQIALAVVGAIDALVITEHILWPVFPSVSCCLSMKSPITADDFHLQRPGYDLTTVSVAETPHVAGGQRFQVDLSALPPSVDFGLT